MRLAKSLFLLAITMGVITGLDSAATAYVSTAFGDSSEHIAQRPRRANVPGRPDFDDDDFEDFRDEIEDRREDREDFRDDMEDRWDDRDDDDWDDFRDEIEDRRDDWDDDDFEDFRDEIEDRRDDRNDNRRRGPRRATRGPAPRGPWR